MGFSPSNKHGTSTSIFSNIVDAETGSFVSSLAVDGTLSAVTGTITDGLTIGTGSTKLYPEGIRVEDGSLSVPSIAFASDPNTGMFSVSSGRLGFAVGGSLRAEVTSSGIEVPAGHRVTVDDVPLALITEVGEVNTGNSSGGGEAIFVNKSGPQFNFRTVEGNNGIDTLVGGSAVQIRFNGNAENLVETRNLQILNPEDRTYVVDFYAQYIYDVLEVRFQTTSGNPVFTVANSNQGDIDGLTSIIASGTQAVATRFGTGNEDRILIGEGLEIAVSSSAGSSDLVFSVKTRRQNNP